MVIIPNKTEQIEVKIPNNLQKSSGQKTLTLKNTTTKKTYSITFTDEGTSSYFYIFDYTFTNIPYGEYEYSIEGNKGLLRVSKSMEKDSYDLGITFKSYEA